MSTINEYIFPLQLDYITDSQTAETREKIGKYMSLGGLIGGCVLAGIGALYVLLFIIGMIGELANY